MSGFWGPRHINLQLNIKYGGEKSNSIKETTWKLTIWSVIHRLIILWNFRSLYIDKPATFILYPLFERHAIDVVMQNQTDFDDRNNTLRSSLFDVLSAARMKLHESK